MDFPRHTGEAPRLLPSTQLKGITMSCKFDTREFTTHSHWLAARSVSSDVAGSMAGGSAAQNAGLGRAAVDGRPGEFNHHVLTLGPSGKPLAVPSTAPKVRRGLNANSVERVLEMNRLALACLLSAAITLPTAPTLTAQGTTYAAYPQDTTTGAWTNTVPLGQGDNGAGQEARAQMLIPRSFLPSTGGTIVGLEVVAGVSRSLTYQSLQLALDHFASPVPFPVLQTSFAANLTAPSTVLSITNQAINYPGLQWHRLTFQQPFAYNGRDHLLLDFIKYVPPQAGGLGMRTSRDERIDTPWVLTAAGDFGSGAARAATGALVTRPLRTRVLFAGGTPTTVISSPMVGTTYYGIGTNIGLNTQATPGTWVWQALDLAPPGLGGRTTPLRLPGLVGDGWLLPGPMLFGFPIAVIPPSGVHSTILSVPNDPALRGVTTVFQSIVVGSAGAAWSSATDCTIG
jgi:hypothetical protein